MDKLAVRPYTQGDFSRISPRDDINDYNSIVDNLRIISENSSVWVIYENTSTEIVCICGVTPMWPGVGEIWFVGTNLIKQHRVEFYKIARRGLMFLVNHSRYHRLQCAIISTNDRYEKFVEHFGFKREGVMLKYSPQKEDYIRYAKIF